MEALWRPVGPHAEAVYWRRRVVLATAVVLALLVLRSLLTGSEGDSLATRATPAPTGTSSATPATPTSSASPRPAATSTAAPSPAPTLAQCRDNELAATVEPAAGSPPRSFLVTVVNRSDRACTRDLGPGVVDLVVTSGQDRIWVRSHCDRRTAREVATLPAGKSRAVRVAWDGRRSRPGCPDGGAVAASGTYRVEGKVASKPIAPEVFRIG